MRKEVHGRFERSALDYLLVFLASASSVVSAGHALSNPAAGYVLAGLIAIGYFVSAAVSAAHPEIESRTRFDGWFMSIAMVAVIFMNGQLSPLLPESGFPPQLFQSTILSFMLVVIAFFSWNDGTMLFQAVPGIALFGLIGAYDTFEYAPAYFFLFLLCTAIMFSRSSMRASLNRAHKFHDVGIGRLEKAEWRSLAGPEWALASALIVIGFSALGAPVIQRSVHSVTSGIQVQTPQLPNAPRNSNRRGMSGLPGAIRVGTGPIFRPSDSPAVVARMSEITNLKLRSYSIFSDGQWTNPQMPLINSPMLRQGVFDLRPITMAKTLAPEARELPWEIEYIQGNRNLVYPGEAVWLQTSRQNLFGMADASVGTFPQFSSSETLRGLSVLNTYNPGDAPSVPPPTRDGMPDSMYTYTETTQRVKELAMKVIAGKTTDYDRAIAIEMEVATRIKYNLEAGPVPDGRNPADFALFDSHEGYCDLFATSVALMARSVGLNSRVTIGYLVQQSNFRSDGSYLMKDSDYHMWPEIYFRGVGWVPFDATEYAEEVPGSGRGSAWKDPKPWWDRGATFWGAIGVAIGAAAFFLVKPMIPRWLALILGFKGAFALKSSPKTLQMAAQSSISRFISRIERKTKIPRWYGMTMAEYFARVGSTYEIPPERISAMTEYADRITFSSAPVSVDDLRAFDSISADYASAIYHKADEARGRKVDIEAARPDHGQ